MQSNLRPTARVTGFSLVELMVTITIAAIILSFAVPSFSSMIKQNRLSAVTGALVIAMQYARSTALATGKTVSVCPIGVAGSGTCGTNWGAGWIVKDSANVLLQSYQIGLNDPVLAAVPSSGVTPQRIDFDIRGLATTQANFKFCDSRGAAFARSVQVLPTGFVQAGPTSGTAIWGGSLTCP